MTTPIKLIVGLGNPGQQYDNTRHNAGADFVVALCREHGQPLTPEKKFHGLTARLRLAQGDIIHCLVPTTYMNRSGQSVAALASFYKITSPEMLVVHDELDLAPGTARLKHGGGHGGHNGLRDIINALGNDKNFYRLRLGIGHPGQANRVADYVLTRAPLGERQALTMATERALEQMPQIATGRWNEAMKTLHTTAN